MRSPFRRISPFVSPFWNGAGGGSPTLNSVFYDEPTSVLSGIASDIGTMYYVANDIEYTSNQGAAVKAASIAAAADVSGSYATEEGANNDALSFGGVTDGDHFVSLVYENAGGLFSNVVSEEYTFSSSYTQINSDTNGTAHVNFTVPNAHMDQIEFSGRITCHNFSAFKYGVYGYPLRLQFDTDNKLEVILFDNTTSVVYSAKTNTTALVAGTEYHYHGVIDMTAGTCVVSIDNVTQSMTVAIDTMVGKLMDRNKGQDIGGTGSYHQDMDIAEMYLHYSSAGGFRGLAYFWNSGASFDMSAIGATSHYLMGTGTQNYTSFNAATNLGTLTGNIGSATFTAGA